METRTLLSPNAVVQECQERELKRTFTILDFKIILLAPKGVDASCQGKSLIDTGRNRALSTALVALMIVEV